MAVDSRAKGRYGETKVRDKLRELTGKQWERIPCSGALDAKHGLKGDLYVPEAPNEWCVEVKNYTEDGIKSSSVFHTKGTIFPWWEQAITQAAKVKKKPLLLYTFNRGKIYACVEFTIEAFNKQPKGIVIKGDNGLPPILILLLEDFVKGFMND